MLNWRVKLGEKLENDVECLRLATARARAAQYEEDRALDKQRKIYMTLITIQLKAFLSAIQA